MKPPIVPHALVTAVTPPVDHDCVLGDLHEEYIDRALSQGRMHADSWYWSQAMRSLPALLTYSRSQPSVAARLGTVITVAMILIAMLVINEFVAHIMYLLDPDISAKRSWVFYLAGWADAVVFGAILARIKRSQGVRLAIVSATALQIVIAIPIAIGVSSRLTTSTWLLILGAIPAMGLGAGAYQIIRRRN